MRTLNLRQLETLRQIAVSGSLVAAAGQLNMTPAALTARVKALEETLGLPLFERTPAGLKPNMAGVAALESAQDRDRPEGIRRNHGQHPHRAGRAPFSRSCFDG